MLVFSAGIAVLAIQELDPCSDPDHFRCRRSVRSYFFRVVISAVPCGAAGAALVTLAVRGFATASGVGHSALLSAVSSERGVSGTTVEDTSLHEPLLREERMGRNNWDGGGLESQENGGGRSVAGEPGANLGRISAAGAAAGALTIYGSRGRRGTSGRVLGRSESVAQLHQLPESYVYTYWGMGI